MITKENREYAILMLEYAIANLKHSIIEKTDIHDDSAIDYIKSGLGELIENQ